MQEGDGRKVSWKQRGSHEDEDEVVETDHNCLIHAGLTIIPPPSRQFYVTTAATCPFYYHQTFGSVNIFTILMQISDPTQEEMMFPCPWNWSYTWMCQVPWKRWFFGEKNTPFCFRCWTSGRYLCNALLLNNCQREFVANTNIWWWWWCDYLASSSLNVWIFRFDHQYFSFLHFFKKTHNSSCRFLNKEEKKNNCSPANRKGNFISLPSYRQAAVKAESD